MNDINKDELLDVKKWQRLFFMVIYAAAANFVIGIVLFLIFLQFIFYLFTSNINDQLKSANNWLKDFRIVYFRAEGYYRRGRSVLYAVTFFLSGEQLYPAPVQKKDSRNGI